MVWVTKGNMMFWMVDMIWVNVSWSAVLSQNCCFATLSDSETIFCDVSVNRIIKWMDRDSVVISWGPKRSAIPWRFLVIRNSYHPLIYHYVSWDNCWNLLCAFMWLLWFVFVRITCRVLRIQFSFPARWATWLCDHSGGISRLPLVEQSLKWTPPIVIYRVTMSSNWMEIPCDVVQFCKQKFRIQSPY